MANTYTQLFVHIVFAVKGRQSLIPIANRDELYNYFGGIIANKDHKSFIINGMADHVHLLIGLNPSESLSSLVKEIKRCSSIFINEKRFVRGKFEWQSGYGAFTYSKSQIDSVYKYIVNQESHHKKKSFMEEYVELLERFNIEI